MAEFHLSDADSLVIANAAWGVVGTPSEESRRASLATFFRQCELEVDKCFHLPSPPVRRERAAEDIVRIIEDLVSDPTRRREELISHGLDLGVVMLFMTGSHPPTGLAWLQTESLSNFMSRVYTTHNLTGYDAGHRRLRLRSISAANLKRHGRIRIVWTDQLSNHLRLKITSNKKILFLFSHASFLEQALKRLSDNDATMSHSMADALRLGCLHPRLLRETLMTLQVLFPAVGDDSRAMLASDISTHGLDPHLLGVFSYHYGPSEEHHRGNDVFSSADLLRVYQYWGPALNELLMEVDDPTPITRRARWADRRKSPRFTYWCTAVGICFALFFGIAATMLAAIQVWLSWCAFVEAPTMFKCHRLGPKNPPS